jgi:hypothetical protein
VGICIFHLCNYIYLTLIPFKYPRLNRIQPYTKFEHLNMINNKLV